jgi:methionine-rich copper-binding protein CopC
LHRFIKSRLKPVLIILLLVLLGTVYVSPALADGISLSASTPQSGQKNVKLPVIIKLSFSENVTNMKVKEDNAKCFALVDAAGATNNSKGGKVGNKNVFYGVVWIIGGLIVLLIGVYLFIRSKNKK